MKILCKKIGTYSFGITKLLSWLCTFNVAVKCRSHSSGSAYMKLLWLIFVSVLPVFAQFQDTKFCFQKQILWFKNRKFCSLKLNELSRQKKKNAICQNSGHAIFCI